MSTCVYSACRCRPASCTCPVDTERSGFLQQRSDPTCSRQLRAAGTVLQCLFLQFSWTLNLTLQSRNHEHAQTVAVLLVAATRFTTTNTDGYYYLAPAVEAHASL